MTIKLVIIKKGASNWVLKARLKDIPEAWVLFCRIKKWALVALLLIPFLFVEPFPNTSDREKVEVIGNHSCRTV